MSHTLKTERCHSLAYCADCEGTHMGGRCGMTFAQRLRSVRLDTSVTPTRTQKNYFDDDALTEVFGGKDADERHEQMLEETRGVEYASQEEIAQHTDLAAAHYLDSTEA